MDSIATDIDEALDRIRDLEIARENNAGNGK